VRLGAAAVAGRRARGRDPRAHRRNAQSTAAHGPSADRALERFLDELLRAADTVELVAGLALAHDALAAAYSAHLDGSNPM
jgi:hypothetical protein